MSYIKTVPNKKQIPFTFSSVSQQSDKKNVFVVLRLSSLFVWDAMKNN